MATRSDGLAAGDFERHYFSGNALYGDNFDAEQIAAWFADEENGYADLIQAEQGGPRGDYGYDIFNQWNGYRHLPRDRRFRQVLAFGSAHGDELVPLLPRCDQVNLLDASARFQIDQIQGVPVNFLLAHASGRVDLEDRSLDLITCFGVLHHIPNVSKVLAEFHRVLMPGGLVLIREPMTSMGDWRKQRPGLTSRERGIPRELFLKMVSEAGFKVLQASDCGFSPLTKLLNKLSIAPYGHAWLVKLDALLARVFRFNYCYHRTGIWSRFSPAHIFILAERQA